MQVTKRYYCNIKFRCFRNTKYIMKYYFQINLYSPNPYYIKKVAISYDANNNICTHAIKLRLHIGADFYNLSARQLIGKHIDTVYAQRLTFAEIQKFCNPKNRFYFYDTYRMEMRLVRLNFQYCTEFHYLRTKIFSYSLIQYPSIPEIMYGFRHQP